MIYYFGNYSRQAKELELYQSPAAASKMEYILDTIKKTAQCTLISLTVFQPRKWKLRLARKNKYNENEVDVVMPSLGSPIRVIRGFNSFIIPVFAFLYTLLHVTKKDTVILYHALSYTKPIVLCKRIKRFKLCIDVEEIYGDVYENAKTVATEMRMFKFADSFLFPTHLLNQKVNKTNKPAVIVHGTYRVERCRECGFSDESIHVVYAGTLDPRKGGAVAAVAAAAYLPENYHIHILGFGGEKQIQQMKELCMKSSKQHHAQVTYDGVLSGEDYICFIQSCDIGLSTQNPDAAFNATSFPSKVLSYLSNGLHVVSVRIPAIEQSAIGDLLEYYDQQTPEGIAQAIMRVDLHAPYDARERISQMDMQFQAEIGKMIEDFEREYSC